MGAVLSRKAAAGRASGELRQDTGADREVNPDESTIADE
jgi:hypothetical protein